jgi:hypothetical protein
VISEDLLKKFPAKRIKSFDGMAITAQTWDEAHDYHRLQQRFHALFNHGVGIVTGLEVIASDPPDTSVYVLPGIAVDPLGQTIVLPQPVSYDIGREMEGLLYILLSYGESRPRTDEDNPQADDPKYIHAEFSLFARTVLPAGPWVELARIARQSRDASFHNARNWAKPGPNEIDLRFRREVGTPPDVSLAVCYLGAETVKGQGLGLTYLAQAINRLGPYRVAVMDNVALAPGVESNTLIYLVGQGAFELSPGQMNGLYNYVQRGRGTLLIESLDPTAESIFLNMLKTLNLPFDAIPPGHRVLTDPYLFPAPPAGFETQGSPRVALGEGVIFSTHNYARLWQGQQRDGVPSREQIRSAIEWGTNIIAYAAYRRQS